MCFWPAPLCRTCQINPFVLFSDLISHNHWHAKCATAVLTGATGGASLLQPWRGDANINAFVRSHRHINVVTPPPHSGVVSLVPTPRMYIYINDVKFRRVRVKIYIICRPPCRPPCRPHDGQIWLEKQNCFCGIFFLGFLGKHPRNICLSTYIYLMYILVGGDVILRYPRLMYTFQRVRQKWPPPPPKYTLN